MDKKEIEGQPEQPPEKRLTKSESSTKAWGRTIMENMKRMAEDEEYRLEIAKNLS